MPALLAIQNIEASLKGAVQESFAYVLSGEEVEKEEFQRWDAFLEGPGDLGQVLGDTAVFHARELGGKGRHQLGGGVELGHRLEDERRRHQILGAGREVGVEL